ncbi:hypothetical protein AWC38_SpisGene13532 [Stylophora pistillata]|uniref:Uncharacterized protein n=1 Tax=Stylophora pistillata TaxID=50429 RepID=A0A2B4S073_STYPI|nr:hypothetical protein AWC38_SpisGene13532 [Stylophora pistillata]
MGNYLRKALTSKSPEAPQGASTKEANSTAITLTFAAKESTALEEPSRSSQEPLQKRSTTGQSPKESTGLEEPRDSPKDLPQRQIAG